MNTPPPHSAAGITSAIRRLFGRRKTTAPVIPTQQAVPVWKQDGHFQVGDQVQSPPGDFFPTTVTWIDGDRVGTRRRKNDRGDQAFLAQLRHASGCEPCMTDAAAQDAAEVGNWLSYWEKWPADDRALYDAIQEDMERTAGGERWRFGPAAPVYEWMRTEFDGHMVYSDSPSLALGRIWDPIDWLRIEREHAGSGLTICNPWGEEDGSLPWPEIRRAYALAVEAGLTVSLDVDLEMAVNDARTAVGVEVVVTAMAIEGTVPDELNQQICTILGLTPYSYPHSSLMRPLHLDRPGVDYAAPYRHHTDNQTYWRWT